MRLRRGKRRKADVAGDDAAGLDDDLGFIRNESRVFGAKGMCAGRDGVDLEMSGPVGHGLGVGQQDPDARDRPELVVGDGPLDRPGLVGRLLTGGRPDVDSLVVDAPGEGGTQQDGEDGGGEDSSWLHGGSRPVRRHHRRWR